MTDEKPTSQAQLDELRSRYDSLLLLAQDVERDNVRLRNEARAADVLRGPGYVERMVCNDGRTWARPEHEVREDYIRYFAGQAMGHAMASPPSPKAVAAARKVAFMLWLELESWLEPEREARRKREATETETDAKQGDLLAPLADIADEAAEKLDDKLTDEPEGEGEK
jgi:hypothetical protein